MTGLADRLRALIAAEGPLGLERVMALALGDPNHGYYATQEPFGAGGDFVTAPEISQMFGELIGLWCAITHEQMGAPRTFALVELGPGRGTLMADALRATNRIETFRTARQVHLIETSARLRDRQAAALAAERVTFHARLEDVPDGPAILIANEFFDALPTRQFVATSAGWCERLVDWDHAAGAFRFCAGEQPAVALPAWLPPPSTVPPGTLAEHAPERERVAALIGQRLARHGGAALIFDYGHDASACGDTLQAVRAHRYVDILNNLGAADLTTHVDFAALRRAAEQGGASRHGPIGQGRFLRGLGIEARATRLMRGATPAQCSAVQAALERLTGPSAMGELFKAMALTHPGLPTPAGFETLEVNAAERAYG